MDFANRPILAGTSLIVYLPVAYLIIDVLFLVLQANELLLAGRKITAIEAYQIGLVSQVFWPTSMMQEVIPRLQNMSSYSAKVSTHRGMGYHGVRVSVRREEGDLERQNHLQYFHKGHMMMHVSMD